MQQIANVSTSDARTLTVQAFERTMLPEIAKAIINSNLGLEACSGSRHTIKPHPHCYENNDPLLLQGGWHPEK